MKLLVLVALLLAVALTPALAVRNARRSRTEELWAEPPRITAVLGVRG